MRRDSPEYGTACISHEPQRRTHVHRATPEFNAKSNGPTSLGDCKCPIARTDENTCCKLFEETGNTLERNDDRRWKWLIRNPFPPGPNHNHPPEEQKEEDKSLADTVAGIRYKE